jgi:SAM-dependent methyltransferase
MRAVGVTIVCEVHSRSEPKRPFAHIVPTGRTVTGTEHDNLALTASWVSPVRRSPLTWDARRRTFASAAGETFVCLADNIPDLRDGGPPLSGDEIIAIQRRLEQAWADSDTLPELPQVLTAASIAATWRYWFNTACSETLAFARWYAHGSRSFTQGDSMRLYRNVTDVYPRALRRTVTVLTDRRVATAPLTLFKRLSLQPVVDLIRRRNLRSVLDFGCGWGANTIILRQILPRVDVWSFDYSPQRVLNTRFNLHALGLRPYRLFVADGSRLPLPDNAVDLVISTHVLEQMQEVLPAALRETFRVARRYAFHIEPTYDFARWPHRLRMRRLGYPRDVGRQAEAAGWRILERRRADPAWGRTPAELLLLEKS